MQIIKQIFEKEPNGWGLRGDPHLWVDLRDYMLSTKQLLDVEELDSMLKDAFKEKTGHDLKPGQKIFIKRYDTGGMSSGHVDSDFWLEKAFPLLRERFIKMNN
ncbi:hypothetical protein TH63_13495 [Rufibacter radiotolerans]|uniref:Uncharacterized protein n=1 Tax=Rufibacter radiotolerans TaxID=1379910 RepID=A0A0H4VR41_9BACT|nr:hypothetical protein [Rufibacter radiotolerans]AKQ46407.1 hypothetical protein TH63_13495 [Rufibacter radiotolerans]